MTIGLRQPASKTPATGKGIPEGANKSRDLQTDALLARAFFEYRRNEFKKAAAIARYLVTTQGHPEALRVFSSASHRAGDEAAAMETYPRALAAFPSDVALHVGYAELLLDRHDFGTAVTHLRSAIELDPTASHPAGARARILIVKASGG